MTAVHAGRLAGIELGGTGIVNGVGGVGLMVLQVLAAAGVRPIAVADSADKGDLARAAGAAETIVLEGGVGYDELPDRVRELTAGAGADYYFELVGSCETMLAGLRALGRAGTCTIIGYTGEDLVVSPVELSRDTAPKPRPPNTKGSKSTVRARRSTPDPSVIGKSSVAGSTASHLTIAADSPISQVTVSRELRYDPGGNPISRMNALLKAAPDS